MSKNTSQRQTALLKDLPADRLQEELGRLQTRLADTELEYAEFAYQISHDLTGYFRQICGLMDILMDGMPRELQSKEQRRLNLVRTTAQEGMDVLQGLLNFSRVNTHTTPFDKHNLHAVIARVLEELEPLSSHNNPTIELTGLPTVIGDGPQLEKLLCQLLRNALLYQPVSQVPHVCVSAEETDSHWVILIKDNGIGIQERHRERVFGVLKRAVRLRDYAGVGMGIPVARRIAQRHGGDITFESTVGKGSTFRVTLSKEPLDVSDLSSVREESSDS